MSIKIAPSFNLQVGSAGITVEVAPSKGNGTMTSQIHTAEGNCHVMHDSRVSWTPGQLETIQVLAQKVMDTLYTRYVAVIAPGKVSAREAGITLAARKFNMLIDSILLENMDANSTLDAQDVIDNLMRAVEREASRVLSTYMVRTQVADAVAYVFNPDYTLGLPVSHDYAPNGFFEIDESSVNTRLNTASTPSVELAVCSYGLPGTEIDLVDSNYRVQFLQPNEPFFLLGMVNLKESTLSQFTEENALTMQVTLYSEQLMNPLVLSYELTTDVAGTLFMEATGNTIGSMVMFDAGNSLQFQLDLAQSEDLLVADITFSEVKFVSVKLQATNHETSDKLITPIYNIYLEHVEENVEEEQGPVEEEQETDTPVDDSKTD